MISIVTQPSKWQSIYSNVKYDVSLYHELPIASFHTLTPIGGLNFGFATVDYWGYFEVGDKVLFYIGGSSLSYVVYKIEPGIIYLTLISIPPESIPTSFSFGYIYKTKKALINVYAGYRQGLIFNKPLEKIATVAISAAQPDELTALYSFNISKYLQDYIGEVKPPLIGTDTSLFCHYKAEIVYNNVTYQIGGIKCGLSGSVAGLNTSDYVTEQKQLNDTLIKNTNAFAITSFIRDEVVVNKLYDGVLPEPPPSGGGNVNIRRSDGTSIAAVTAPADYSVADSAITLKNTNNTTVGTDTIKAASAKNVNVPDATIEVENTNGDTLFSANKPAGVTSFVVAPDAYVELVNMDGVSLFTVSAKSGADTQIIAPYSDIRYRRAIRTMNLVNTGNF